LTAVRDVAKARGIATVAANAGLGRESLYKTLKKKGPDTFFSKQDPKSKKVSGPFVKKVSGPFVTLSRPLCHRFYKWVRLMHNQCQLSESDG